MTTLMNRQGDQCGLDWGSGLTIWTRDKLAMSICFYVIAGIIAKT